MFGLFRDRNKESETQPEQNRSAEVDQLQPEAPKAPGAAEANSDGSHGDRAASNTQEEPHSAGSASSNEQTASQEGAEQVSSSQNRSKNGSVSQRLDAAGYVLPPVAAPVAAYVPAVPVMGAKGRVVQVQTSGQLPMVDGKLAAVGKVGREISQSMAYQLARVAALNALAAGASIAGGVDRIESVHKVTVFVSSDEEFYGQAAVANGASEFYGELFDEGHARSAVGVAVLPLNSPVEVEVVFNVS